VLREERRGTHGGAILDALLGRVGDPTTVADEMDDANVDVSRTAQQQRVRGDLRRIDDNVGPGDIADGVKKPVERFAIAAHGMALVIAGMGEESGDASGTVHRVARGQEAVKVDRCPAAVGPLADRLPKCRSRHELGVRWSRRRTANL
jgi:hypothetical protein